MFPTPPSLPYLSLCEQTELTQLKPQTFLHPTEAETLAHKPTHQQTSWLLGRLAVKRSIAAYYRAHEASVKLTDILIDYEPSGRPNVAALAQYPNVTPPLISISHTDTLGAAVAVSPQTHTAVGVDVETIRTFSPNTITHFLTAAEHHTLGTAPSKLQPELATTYWSLKEAYSKALGTGLRTHPQTISLHFADGSHTPHALTHPSHPAPTLVYSTLLENKSHVLSCICI